MHGALQDDFPAAFLTEAFEESVSLVLFIGFFAEELIPQLDFLVPHVLEVLMRFALATIRIK